MSKKLPGDPDAAKGLTALGAKRRAERANLVLLEQARACVKAREARQYGEQNKLFALEAFVRFGFPLVPPRNGELEWIRADHEFEYRLVGDPKYGLPHGLDFVTLYWLISAYVKLGCPEDGVIRVRAASDIERAFDPALGKMPTELRRRLRGSLERLSGVTVWTSPKTPGRSQLAFDKFDLIEGMDLWFKDPVRRRRGANQYTLDQLDLFTNWIRISPRLRALCADPVTRPVPVDLESVAALRKLRNKLALRLYVWMVWRSFQPDVRAADADPRRRGLRVPIFGPLGLAQTLGIDRKDDEISRRNTRRDLRAALELVRQMVWPECPNVFEKNRPDVLVVHHFRGAVRADAKFTIPGIRRDHTGSVTRRVHDLVTGGVPEGRLLKLPPAAPADADAGGEE